MEHLFTYRYIYREELRSIFVQYIDGSVNATDHNGNLHNLTYNADTETLTGPGQLAESHRRAIAGIIATAIAQVEATLIWANP